MNGLPCWSMPAPWGGIAVYACEGEPTAIVPTLTPVTEPEAAPEAVSEILALLEDVLAVPRATDPSVKDKLFATRIFRELPEFTRRVLTLTADIAPAAWTSYTELAEGIGSPAAARAVGQAQFAARTRCAAVFLIVVGKFPESHGVRAQPVGGGRRAFVFGVFGHDES